MSISILECDLEKFVYANRDRIHEKGFVKLLSHTERQFRLESGRIIDLLSWEIDEEDTLSAILIELKKDEINVAALIQIGDYISEFGFGAYRSFKRIKIRSILCGSDISEEVESILCLEPRLSIITFELGFDGISFNLNVEAASIIDDAKLENTSIDEYLSEKLRQPYKELNQLKGI